MDRCPACKKDVLVPSATSVFQIDSSILLRPVEDLTIEELAANRSMIDLFNAWIDIRKPAIDQRVLTEKLNLPGYTIVTKSGTPFIPADKTAEAYELLKGDLTPEEFIAACGKPSLSKLVDALADSQEGASLEDRKAQARERLFTLTEELIAQTNGSTYLRRRGKIDISLLQPQSPSPQGT